MIGSIKNWLLGSSTVKGTDSVQPNPSSVAEIQYYKGFNSYFQNPQDSFTDKYFQSAPVGYSIDKPTEIKFNLPKQFEVVSTPEVRTSNAPLGRDCK